MSAARPGLRHLAAATVFAASVAGVLGAPAPPAGADTPADTLLGTGGSFLAPVVNALENADTSQAAPYFAYQNVDVDKGIADFVGTGKGQFDSDFAVSERALTAKETAKAEADGRSFAYVPIAATPVAIVDLVFCTQPQQTAPFPPADWCPDVPLTTVQLAELLEKNYQVIDPNNPLVDWASFDGSAASGGTALTTTQKFGSWANVLDPNAESTAVLSLIDSNPAAKAIFAKVLTSSENRSGLKAVAPTEVWPLQGQNSYAGGDQIMIEKEIDIDPATEAPGNAGQWVGLGFNPGQNASAGLTNGDEFAVSSVWTGSPEGTPWDLPSAAMQNAAGAFVAPTPASAQEAETGPNATMDPATNLVTFHPSTTDQAAYNNYLMAETYLVVPTNGLPPAKAAKLAQFIRFILGPQGQAVISQFGAAPATATEANAGLAVAAELSQEAETDAQVTSTSTTSTSASTPSTSPTSTTSTTGSSSAAETSADESSSGGGSSSGSSSGLAFTGGGAQVPLAGLGATAAVVGALLRRRFRTKVVTS